MTDNKDNAALRSRPVQPKVRTAQTKLKRGRKMFNANSPAEKINEVMLQKEYDETEWEVVGINPNVLPFSDGQFKQKIVKVNRKQAELIAENVGNKNVYAIQRGKNFQFLPY